MKKLNKGDLSLNPKQISNLNESGYTAVPTSKEDCKTDATCQTHCAQATCPDYSQVDENCKETFATRCLCGGSKNCGDTLGCGTKSGGALCCDTGGTCDNCYPLSQGNNCESKDYIKCDDTIKDCFDSLVCETQFQNCALSKDGEIGEISVCACAVSIGVEGCLISRPCETENITCNGDV